MTIKDVVEALRDSGRDHESTTTSRLTWRSWLRAGP